MSTVCGFANVATPVTGPDRASAPVPKIDWSQSRSWDFSAPDLDRFPLLGLAYRSLEQGGSATCTLNAADEIAVEAFLQERIGFLGIASIVEETLSRVPTRQLRNVGDILEIDSESRARARELVSQRGATVRV